MGITKGSHGGPTTRQCFIKNNNLNSLNTTKYTIIKSQGVCCQIIGTYCSCLPLITWPNKLSRDLKAQENRTAAGFLPRALLGELTAVLKPCCWLLIGPKTPPQLSIGPSDFNLRPFAPQTIKQIWQCKFTGPRNQKSWLRQCSILPILYRTAR